MSYRLRYNLLLGLSVVVLMIFILAPFYWIFSSSIKIPQEIIARKPSIHAS